MNDFGIEIDLASQIVRNNFFIYEYGVSYFFRSKAQGKKITWVAPNKATHQININKNNPSGQGITKSAMGVNEPAIIINIPT